MHRPTRPRRSLGLLARLDNSGLGTLCQEFARHIKFDQMQVVSNGRYAVHKERGYNFVDDLTTDIVLSFETFYGIKPKKGQKFILVPMYECTRPQEAAMADKVISPSLLDKQFYPKSEFIPIPIATDRIPFRERWRADVFVHNAGHGGLGGRNGTLEVVEAMRFVRSNIKLVINSQVPVKCDDKRVEVRVRDIENYWDIWGEGDVFLFPEKFNGLSLPIQEAMSSGMAIMSTSRFPFSAYLPRELLIPVERYTQEHISVPFQMAHVSSRKIAEHIDKWAFKDISQYSQQMRSLAELLSWEKLKDKWKSAIASV